MNRTSYITCAVVEFIVALSMTVVNATLVAKGYVPLFSISMLMLSILPILMYGMCAYTLIDLGRMEYKRKLMVTLYGG